MIACIIIIFLTDVCKTLKAPVNGRLNCSSIDRETRCIAACEDGYEFAIEPANFNIVNDELLLKCNSSDRMWESNYLPECSGICARFMKIINLSIISSKSLNYRTIV